MRTKNFGGEASGGSGGSGSYTGTPYQDFVATEGQTDFICTTITPTAYFHVTVDNVPDMPATRNLQTITLAPQGAGAKVRVYA